MGCIAGNAHIVYHIFDQEQPPATWRLQFRQLRLDIWRLSIVYEQAV